MVAPRIGTFGNAVYDGVIQQFRRWGAYIGVHYCRSDNSGHGIREIQTVFLSCPRDRWINTFGEPQHVRMCFDAIRDEWFLGWEQQTPTGSFECSGQWCEKEEGRAWIIVKQIVVMQQDALVQPSGRESS